ncbi:MAG: hypothetical protein ACRD8W_20130, partial [Nitrososphaeraceae archaeon]
MNLESKDTISSAARPENTTGRGDGRDRSVLSKTYYDGLASEFDELNDYWSNPYDSATWDKENALVGQYLGSYDLLLDLGVGFYPHIESTSEKQLVCV